MEQSLDWQIQSQQPRTVGNGVIAPQYTPFNMIDQALASGQAYLESQGDSEVSAKLGALQDQASRRIKGIKSLMSTVQNA